MKRHIPNFLTLINLFCGCIAVVFASSGHFIATALFVFLGIFFDFFDGFAARKLNVQSELGIQLDSLADMVTSGLVPGIVMYKLLDLARLGPQWDEFALTNDIGISLIPMFGFTITLASAYRLAKFNIDEDQQDYFKGLPTPANTLLIISLPLILAYQDNHTLNSIILNTWFLIGLTILSCYLLNSSVKLMALKFKDWSFKNNAFRYILIIVSFLLLLVFKFIAIPVIILVYILLSLLNQSFIVK